MRDNEFATRFDLPIVEVVKPWSTRDVVGIRRWLDRSWRLFVDEESALDPDHPETKC